MIPKTIHYCWFGGAPKPASAEKCIASWRKFCPDCEIKEWNESCFDVDFCAYSREAYSAGKWAFVSDAARLKIIYDEGGIYLDTDAELIKNIDPLLENEAYFGFEGNMINTGLGFGAEKGSRLAGELLNDYLTRHFIRPDGTADLTPCPEIQTARLTAMGFEADGKTKMFGNAKFYSSEYFCPLDFKTGRLTVTENTYSIHYFEASWKTPDERAVMKDTQRLSRRYGYFLGRNIAEYRFAFKSGGLGKCADLTAKKVRGKFGAE